MRRVDSERISAVVVLAAAIVVAACGGSGTRAT